MYLLYAEGVSKPVPEPCRSRAVAALQIGTCGLLPRRTSGVAKGVARGCPAQVGRSCSKRPTRSQICSKWHITPGFMGRSVTCGAHLRRGRAAPCEAPAKRLCKVAVPLRGPTQGRGRGHLHPSQTSLSEDMPLWGLNGLLPCLK